MAVHGGGNRHGLWHCTLIALAVLPIVACTKNDRQATSLNNVTSQVDGTVELDVRNYRAAQPGVLPPDGTPIVGGVALPRGHRVSGHPYWAPERSTARPVLWISDEILDDAGTISTALRRAFPTTGLWPLVLHGLDSEPQRPWDDGEFDPGSATDPDGVDATAVLQRWWSESVPTEDEEPEAFEQLKPFDRDFPGLAPVPQGDADEEAIDRVARNMHGRLGLVPVRRPADVLAVLGWQGTANYSTDAGPLSAVLRSWEDRFGAEPVAVSFDTLILGVRRPPSTESDSLRTAAEIYAVCPDIVWQGVGSITRYAKEIRGKPQWSCWWD